MEKDSSMKAWFIVASFVLGAIFGYYSSSKPEIKPPSFRVSFMTTNAVYMYTNLTWSQLEIALKNPPKEIPKDSQLKLEMEYPK